MPGAPPLCWLLLVLVDSPLLVLFPVPLMTGWTLTAGTASHAEYSTEVC